MPTVSDAVFQVITKTHYSLSSSDATSTSLYVHCGIFTETKFNPLTDGHI